MTQFEYLQRVVVEAELQVEDIGNCVILGRNDIGEESYLMTRSYMGEVEIIEVGPVVPDLSILPGHVSIIYDRFEFSSFKLERRIDKFLNDGKKVITQAEVTDIDSIRDKIPDLINSVFPKEETADE